MTDRPPLTQFQTSLNGADLISAAGNNDTAGLQEILRDQRDCFLLSGQCLRAISKAATCGHMQAIEVLLPWTQKHDPKSPVGAGDRYDDALMKAIEQGQLAVVQRLFPLSNDCIKGESLFIQEAACGGQQAIVRWLLPFANLATAHEMLAKGEEWHGLDMLAMDVDAPTRTAWLTAHPGKLPNTEDMLLAGRRENKGIEAGAINVGDGSRRRWRP